MQSWAFTRQWFRCSGPTLGGTNGHSPAVRDGVKVIMQGCDGQGADEPVDRCPLIAAERVMPWRAVDTVPSLGPLPTVGELDGQHAHISDTGYNSGPALVQGLTLSFGLDQSAQSLGSTRPGWACEGPLDVHLCTLQEHSCTIAPLQLTVMLHHHAAALHSLRVSRAQQTCWRFLQMVTCHALIQDHAALYKSAPATLGSHRVSSSSWPVQF